MKAAVRREMQQADIRSRRRQEIARNGGRARAEKLTPEQRQEIARLGGKARREKIRHANVDGTDVDHNEVKRQIAALVLVVKRGYSAAQIEHKFGWDRRDVERWIEDWQAALSKHMQAQLG